MIPSATKTIQFFCVAADALIHLNQSAKHFKTKHIIDEVSATQNSLFHFILAT